MTSFFAYSHLCYDGTISLNDVKFNSISYPDEKKILQRGKTQFIRTMFTLIHLDIKLLSYELDSCSTHVCSTQCFHQQSIYWHRSVVHSVQYIFCAGDKKVVWQNDFTYKGKISKITEKCKFNSEYLYISACWPWQNNLGWFACC